MKNCATDANNAPICQTAIDLAHRFGLAVAEGVESMADLQALVVMGCDFGQEVLVASASAARVRPWRLPPRWPRQADASALRKRQPFRRGRKHVEDIERHRDQHVVAEDAHELDHGLVAEKAVQTFVGLIGHPPGLI